MIRKPAHKDTESPAGQVCSAAQSAADMVQTIKKWRQEQWEEEALASYAQCTDQMSAKQVVEHHTLGEYIADLEKRLQQGEKSLGQIAYEAVATGKWGPWDQLPADAQHKFQVSADAVVSHWGYLNGFRNKA